jgi:purine-binding chemotaxis protein CheW
MNQNVGGSMQQVEKKAEARGGKFLTFFLGEEEYGLEILKVQEIIGLMSITRVPRTPAYVRGVINLRGKVIPIVELRSKFRMEPVEDTEQTCIIVVQTQGVQFGVVVDRVSEVVDLDSGSIEDAPEFGTDIDTDFILGMGKTGSRVRILVDIDRVLSREELGELV